MIRFLFALAASVMVATTAVAEPVVRTVKGDIEGRVSDGITSYKAIPYAAPPVGELRWRPPQSVKAWTGVRDGAKVGALCVQPPANGDPGVGPMPVSEECLTLNVWSPQDGAAGLPVMVWIHGGGYNNGSGTAALYDGTRLARRGVVVVTINYRLGRLGFFDHPALAASRDPDEPAGNYGVMDQIAALEWVRDNIGLFGGDPSHVTIFGESAGGVAVMQLMVAPAARELFSAAIVQSGLGRQTSARLDQDRPGRPSARTLGAAFARSAGLAGEATADDLRALPAEAFLRPAPVFYSDLILIDGQILTEDVVTAFAQGRQAPVPMIIGTNSAEFWWMKPTEQSVYGQIDDAMPGDLYDDLVASYGGQSGYDANVISDLVFNEPARHLARLHAAAGNPAFLYRFDVVPASNPEPSGGATHASERPYVFDNLGTVGRPLQARDDEAAKVIADYWTAFAKAGDPNGSGRPDWPAMIASGDRLIEFTNDGPVAGPIPFSNRLDLIERFYAR